MKNKVTSIKLSIGFQYMQEDLHSFLRECKRNTQHLIFKLKNMENVQTKKKTDKNNNKPRIFCIVFFEINNCLCKYKLEATNTTFP